MTGKNFGFTLRDMEQEKSPPLWQILLGAVFMAVMLYLSLVGMMSLDIIFPQLLH